MRKVAFMSLLTVAFTVSVMGMTSPHIDSFAVYYGIQEIQALKSFDLCIVNSSLPADFLTELDNEGKYPIAYVSLGEAEPGDPAIFELAKSDLAGENKLWGSVKNPAASCGALEV